MYQNAHMAFAIGNDYCSADLHGARWACHAVYAAEQAFVSQTAKRGSSRHRAPYSGKYHDCHRADPPPPGTIDGLRGRGTLDELDRGAFNLESRGGTQISRIRSINVDVSHEEGL